MYVLTNLTDDKLNELSAAIHEEKKRRFLEKEWIKPELKQFVMQLKWEETEPAHAIKLVREEFGYTLYDSHMAVRAGYEGKEK